MNQQAGEPIRAFVAWLTATADMCAMTVLFECNRQVTYRDNVLQQLVIHGMYDNDIRIRDRSRAAKWNRESMKISMTVNTKDVRLDYR